MRRITVLLALLLLAGACGGGGSSAPPRSTTDPTSAPSVTIPLGPVRWETHTGEVPELDDVRSLGRIEDGSFLLVAGDRLWSLDGTRWTERAGPNEIPGQLAACSSGVDIFVLHEDVTDVWESPLFQPARVSTLIDGRWTPVEAPVRLVTAIGCTRDVVVLGYLEAGPGIEDAWSIEDAWQYFRGNGIAIFDGSSWDTVDLESGNIVALAAGRNGDVWVGAEAGVTRCLGSDCGRIETPLAYSSSLVTSLAVASSGDVWITVSDGVAHFDGRRWNEHYMNTEEWPDVERVVFVDPLGEVLEPQPDRLRPVGVTVAPDGSVWVVTEGGGLLQYDGDRWVVHSPEMGMHRAAHIVAAAADGSVWLALRDVGLYRFVPGTGANPPGGPTEYQIPSEEEEEGA
ncbi:MAG: hypothetical protein OEO77_06980 [Acidimicrobiia bacterium]|nr:hypothetical protein [Acidimicrobiia bacterium]